MVPNPLWLSERMPQKCLIGREWFRTDFVWASPVREKRAVTIVPRLLISRKPTPRCNHRKQASLWRFCGAHGVASTGFGVFGVDMFWTGHGTNMAVPRDAPKRTRSKATPVSSGIVIHDDTDQDKTILRSSKTPKKLKVWKRKEKKSGRESFTNLP
ncbi:hypothetical protein F4808DRAFT_129167 [Astrocystis sublimbata]|nr:hypothetical protein F4808DRAFT_129167 [Astrocystis sublimbata]